jgi:hypothetical protein
MSRQDPRVSQGIRRARKYMLSRSSIGLALGRCHFRLLSHQHCCSQRETRVCGGLSASKLRCQIR